MSHFSKFKFKFISLPNRLKLVFTLEKGFRKMEWDNLDEIMPNEITKFDQNQISKWSHQLAASSYYYSGKSNGSLKRHAETRKAIIGKG